MSLSEQRKLFINENKENSLWATSGLSRSDALAIMNKDQLRPIALSTWKAYIAGPLVARRRECPDEILTYARKVFEKTRIAIVEKYNA